MNVRWRGQFKKDYKLSDAKRIWREEGVEEGIEKGIEIEKGMEKVKPKSVCHSEKYAQTRQTY
jgi:hypothetical protein